VEKYKRIDPLDWRETQQREVLHLINELHVTKIAPNPVKFTSISPFPFIKGKYMSILER
jgi:hypothetical protein